jgi:arylsulfatase
MKFFKQVSLLILLFIIVSCSNQPNKDIVDRPNIILIMADDMGYGDLGYHDNPYIHTPNLDVLAGESVNFKNFYVSPVCAPTRASLLTGRYSIRTGVFDTYSGGAIMAANEITIAESLEESGYKTGLFGKWHLGDSYPSRPQDQGFQESVWHLSGGIGQVGDVFNYYAADSSYFNPVLYKNGKQFKSNGYCTDVFTSEAINFIEQNKEDQFFAYVSYNAPHTPLQVPQEYLDKYQHLTFDSTYYKSRGIYEHKKSKNDLNAAKKVYAMVSNIDDNVGRIIQSLKSNNLWDNTIVIFMTDNGPEQWRYTGGYRGKKSMVREGGIHVPFFMKLPETNFKQVDAVSAHIDVMPTLLELCDVKQINKSKFDGLSLVSHILENKHLPKRTLFFEWQRGYPEKYQNMAVFKDNFKLIGDVKEAANINQFELYNLKEDPYEATNIVNKNSLKAIELKNELDMWYEDIMASENILNMPTITVGTEHERHTILNRNDARGMQFIWAQDDMYVRWDLNIVKEGKYKVNVHFKNPIKDPGELVLRVGRQNFSINNTKTETRTITYDEVLLKQGKASLEAWYYKGWGKGYLTPFYVELIAL